MVPFWNDKSFWGYFFRPSLGRFFFSAFDDAKMGVGVRSVFAQ